MKGGRPRTKVRDVSLLQIDLFQTTVDGRPCSILRVPFVQSTHPRGHYELVSFRESFQRIVWCIYLRSVTGTSSFVPFHKGKWVVSLVVYHFSLTKGWFRSLTDRHRNLYPEIKHIMKTVVPPPFSHEETGFTTKVFWISTVYLCVVRGLGGVF